LSVRSVLGLRVVGVGLVLGACLGLGFGFSTASAGPRRDCAKAAMRKVRAAADKAVQARDYKKAIGLLEPMQQACGATGAPIESAWLAADLAAAYEKTGQLVECQRLMAPLSHPSSSVAATGNAKVMKAIEHNLDRCSKALDAQYATIKPGGCTLAIDRAIATAAAPAALVPPGATAACVALVPGTRARDAEDGDVTCPRVALIWKAAKLERQDLASSGTSDALTDDSVCCNLSAIAAGTLAAGTLADKTLVRVHGQGRDCNGGTADAATDMFYEWKGTTLTLARDASVSFH
jgi:hypothetical protein